MLIKESLFRKILREEARRVMAEQSPGAPAGATAAAATAHAGVAGALKAMSGALAGFTEPKRILDAAIAGWDQCKDPNSQMCKEVISVIDANKSSGSAEQMARVVMTLAGAQSIAAGALATFTSGLSPANVTKVTGVFQNQEATLTSIKAACTPPVAQAPAAGAGDLQYTIARGDTISRIAQRFYDIPVSKNSIDLYKELANYNVPNGSVKDMDTIYLGKVMKLPASLGKFPRKSA